jgi:hypothetical protein
MRTIQLIAVVLLAGCGIAAPPAGLVAEPEALSRSIAAPPESVVRAAIGVFADYGLPIANQDAVAGVVQSGDLTVSGNWRGGAVRDRLYCGRAWDSGVEHTVMNPVTLRVGVVAQPSGGGSVVRLNVSGQAQTRGSAAAAEPCQPTATFARELLDAIAAGAGAGR